MIHFEGEESFSLPVAQLYAKLADASFLVSCLDDVKEVVEATPDRARWKAKAPVSFITGTLDITLEFLERVPDTSTRVRMVSKGVGASSTVETTNTLKSTPEGSTVQWSADVTELTGLLKMVPHTIIQGAASKVIENTWAGVRRELEPGKE